MTATSTTRRRRQAPEPQAPTTITPAVLKLIEQVLAEAGAATLERLSAKDGVLVLHPPEQPFWSSTPSGLWMQDASGAEIRCWIYHESRKGLPMPHWLVSETRVDGRGCQWSHALGPHIVDDFGTLVPVRWA